MQSNAKRAETQCSVAVRGMPSPHTPRPLKQTALVGNEEQIKQQSVSIEKCKEIRNVALADGEMSIAEEQFYIKAQLLERLVELVRDKFRIIGQTDDENKMFAKVCKRWRSSGEGCSDACVSVRSSAVRRRVAASFWTCAPIGA